MHADRLDEIKHLIETEISKVLAPALSKITCLLTDALQPIQ